MEETESGFGEEKGREAKEKKGYKKEEGERITSMRGRGIITLKWDMKKMEGGEREGKGEE